MSSEKRKISVASRAVGSSRHGAFVRELRRAERGSRNWHRHKTGLFVLALVERVWQSRRTPIACTHRFLKARRAVAAVEPAATRDVLDAILDAIVDGVAPQPAVLVTLTRYAKRLEREGRHALAADVYRLIIDGARDAGITDVLPQSYRRLGRCLRELGDWTTALAMYDAGLAVAGLNGDSVGMLWIQVARTNLLRAQGKPGEARAVLDAAISQVGWCMRGDLLANAMHERALLAHDAGDFVGALADFRSALQASEDRDHRFRLLNDLGHASTAAGQIALGRQAHLVVFLTGRERYTRWVAIINLMHIAVLEHDIDVFEQYRMELLQAPMAARLRVDYNFQVGDGYAEFGEPAKARESWARAEQVAIRFDLEAAAGEAAQSIRTGIGRSSALTAAPIDGLQPIVAELAELVRSLMPRSVAHALTAGHESASRAPLRQKLRRGRPPRLDGG